MPSKYLFITKDKVFSYDGKVREMKKVKELDGYEIRLARPMIVYDVEELELQDLMEVLSGPLKLVLDLRFTDFIVYVDHYSKKVEIFANKGKYLELPYSYLPLLRYVLAKIPGGILLENADLSFED
ncbi:MAG: hypothetical protein ASUL_08004 [Candidatus Aramenus sulfurataquae]|jgi:hypothetical protein|uniref:Uncharacterized protein n=2 Tax=Candidatus Aramenus sulfurataquae TaxID=1326980 RepID=W7KHK3_9CREN|nr:MAG: hypothetical protein ASUL_08004 [Candidatus Aramenus sulfurataquae]MCL7344475.1 hypothetical protein [Candidatus Aramenus sulfurataquae]